MITKITARIANPFWVSQASGNFHGLKPSAYIYRCSKVRWTSDYSFWLVEELPATITDLLVIVSFVVHLHLVTRPKLPMLDTTVHTEPSMSFPTT